MVKIFPIDKNGKVKGFNLTSENKEYKFEIEKTHLGIYENGHIALINDRPLCIHLEDIKNFTIEENSDQVTLTIEYDNSRVSYTGYGNIDLIKAVRHRTLPYIKGKSS